MKVTALAVFAAGYVLGTRAGRDRYDQLVAASSRLADRLEERAGRLEPRRARDGTD